MRWLCGELRRRAPTGERLPRRLEEGILCAVLRVTERAVHHRGKDPCVAVHGEEQDRPGAGQLAGWQARAALSCFAVAFHFTRSKQRPAIASTTVPRAATAASAECEMLMA